ALVRPALLEGDLAGQQQLAAAEQALVGARALGEVAVVAGEGGVHRPHLALAEAESGPSGVEQMGGVRPGAAASVLPQMGADGEGAALRGALLRPAAREVQQLVGRGGDGGGGGELAQAG